MTKVFLAAIVLLAASAASGQGIEMVNGRATPSVIVGADGKVWPVVPTPCDGGPCPIVLAPPLPPAQPHGYITCSIARYCLGHDGRWTPAR